MSGESERRQQILEAATEEFAAKGFLGATIKNIAQRAAALAGVDLLVLPTKEALFEAVLGTHLPIFQVVLDPASWRERPPEEVLPLLAQSFLAGADQPVAHRVLRLVAPEVIRRPEVADLIASHLIGRVLDFLKTYLGHQIEFGRLRP